MLGRIPLRRVDALMRLRRPTMNRHVAPTCSHRRLFSNSTATATATATAAAESQRRWVMLNRLGVRHADSKTVAEARTSAGRHLRVSLRCAAPPASSKLCYDFLKEGDNDNEYLYVAAAHGEFLLLEMCRRRGLSAPMDHFVYTPAGADRPPSLSLLPVRDFLTMSESISVLAPYMVLPPTSENTGLLRRGEKDVLVVQVHMWFDRHVPRDQRRLMAEFCVVQPGMRKWELLDPVPILHDQGGEGDELILKAPKYVVSIGERFLCWVHYSSGFVLCDMADVASPKVQYVPFPDEVTCCGDGCGDGDDNGNNSCDDESGDGDGDDNSCDDESDDGDGNNEDDEDDSEWSDWEDESNDDDPITARYMGAAGDRNVKLVSIDPHGDSGFTINTWTMNLGADEPLAWVKDGEIDCEELWELPGYEGLPRLQQKDLQCTHVCLDVENPDVVGILVCNHYTSNDEKVWLIRLNMKTKTLLSAVESFTNEPWQAFFHLPVQLEY